MLVFILWDKQQNIQVSGFNSDPQLTATLGENNLCLNDFECSRKPQDRLLDSMTYLSLSIALQSSSFSAINKLVRMCFGDIA